MGLAQFFEDSCILVMGAVKAGKSTTFNLYTGNTAETGLDNRISAETAEISFYEDKRHIEEGQKCPYPIWMDTPGSEMRACSDCARVRRFIKRPV